MPTISIQHYDYHSPDDHRKVWIEELDEVFHSIDHSSPFTISCEDEEAEKYLMIDVDGDYTLPEYLYEETSYFLETSDEEEMLEMHVGGLLEEYPRRNMIPREQTLELIRRAYQDMDAAFYSYNWIPNE